MELYPHVSDRSTDSWDGMGTDVYSTSAPIAFQSLARAGDRELI